jgi:hypothetical protein
MFNLKKVKVSATGVAIDYEGASHNNPSHPIAEFVKAYPHEDLKNALDALKPFVMKAMQLDWPFSSNENDLFQNADKNVAHALKEYYKVLTDSVKVTGFSLSGEDASSGVIITAKMETKGRSFAVNTPRIVFAQDVFGFESECELAIDNAANEVRLYLMEGKHGEDNGDPNLFNQEPDKDQEPDEQDEKPRKRMRRA